jgi:hypothetical protein
MINNKYLFGVYCGICSIITGLLEILDGIVLLFTLGCYSTSLALNFMAFYMKFNLGGKFMVDREEVESEDARYKHV